MNDNVLGQVPHVNKSLVAHVTFVRTDVVVMTNVIGQLTRLNKPAQICHVVSKGFQKSNSDGHQFCDTRHRPFAAAIAHVGFLPSVLADVSDQGAGLGEGLATDITHTGLLTWENRNHSPSMSEGKYSANSKYAAAAAS